MRILITTGIFPPEVGGPATYVPRIARGLMDCGLGVEVLTAGTQSGQLRHPFPVHRVPKARLPRLLLGSARVVAHGRGVDCIFVNGLEWEVFLSRGLVRTPTVLKIVGDRSWERYRNHRRGELGIDEFQRARVPLRSRVDRGLHRTVVRSADRVLVPSRYLAGLVRGWGLSEDRVHVIHNTAHRPSQIPSRSIVWPGRGRNLLAVGRLVPWKRVPQLIDFMDRLEHDGLIVLGDGPDFEACERLVREHNLEHRVNLKGTVDRAGVWNHLRACDLLVLHSTYEGFPHVLLEAMAVGTPVLASASGGTRELAEYFPDRVKLYPPDRPQQLLYHLREGSVPDRFAPASFPEALQWETIRDETRELLETAAGA